MSALDSGKVSLIAIAAVSATFIAGLAVVLVQGSRVQYLTLAAGAPSGESYILGTALKQVVERHYPKIRLKVVETGGTVESLRMLQEGSVQLAAAQADVTPGPGARIVAILYDDTLQLLVSASSTVRSFVDLRDRRIALARTGGQFQSFLQVAEHFGLRERDFRFVGSNEASADEAFAAGQADAMFRVRALGSPAIQKLVESGKVRFIPIEHAAAMKIQHPAFEPSVIPQGAYLGNPPVPAQDMPSVAIHRTLLARDGANADAIWAVTSVLMERRQEMMQAIPGQTTAVRLLLAQVRRPDPQTGLGPAVHQGALNFYDKDKPSFLQAHADFVGLIITLVLMVASWIWELRRWLQKKQKNIADGYSRRVMKLMGSAQVAESLDALDRPWRELLATLDEAVRDLDADKLSEESFASFRSILQIALDVAKERRTVLSLGVSLVKRL
jgi:hypothetical protein